MREVVIFCEDSFHEKLVGSVLKRLQREVEVGFRLTYLSARGGLSVMHAEFREYLRDLERGQFSIPDMILVVADANCKGYVERKRLFEHELRQSTIPANLVAYAIPDPHIERWMLLDPTAFQAVFERGCTLPALKCRKDEYKRLLRDEIRESGFEAPLGGEEFAEDIVARMDLSRLEIQEASFGHFLRAARAFANRCRLTP